MDTNFTWSVTEKGVKAILYNNYLYHLKRENKNGSLIYVCTFKSCSRAITLKNNVIIKSNGGNHNHDPKLPENVQAVYCGLKRRILTDIDEPVTKLYEEEVKKFVSDCLIYLLSMIVLILFSVEKMVQLLQFQSSEHGNQFCTLFVKQYYLQHQHRYRQL
jgi:FLYWCH zinc finger domain